MKLSPRGCALDALRKSIRINRGRVKLAKPSRYLSADRKIKSAALACEGSLADDAARLAAGRALIDQLYAHHQRTKQNGYQHFLVTFCWDAGVLCAEAPFDYDLKAMSIKVYRALKRVGLSGICVFEVVGLRKSKHNPERLIIHIHAVCWTRDKSFKPVATAKKLCEHFPNALGAPSVSIQSRKMAATRFLDKKSPTFERLFSKLHKDQTKASMAWLGYYLFQAPAWVKQLVPKKDRKDGLAMRSNGKNYSHQLALALDSLLSEIKLVDAVFSVGDGKQVAGPWRTQYHKEIADLERPKFEARKSKRSKKRASGCCSQASGSAPQAPAA